jgi:pSer/pThr/pTyr-binding forkhead associated (FHA) protein
MKVCPACGFKNEDVFKFCLECGAGLPEPQAAAPAPVAQPVVQPQPVPEPQPQVVVAAPEPQVVAPPEEAQPAYRPTAEEAAPQAAADPQPVNLGSFEEESAQEEVHEELHAAPFMTGGHRLCHACGAVLDAEAVFCPNCGTKYRAPEKALKRTRPRMEAAGAEREQAGELIKIREDGTRGKSVPLYNGINLLGRERGDLTFPQDAFLSPTHCKFTLQDGVLTVEDLGSENGVFVRIDQPVRLEHGDHFRLGQELLRFELVDELRNGKPASRDGTEAQGSDARQEPWAVLSQMLTPDSWGRRVAIVKDRAALGREGGEVVFPEDGYVSRLHAELSRSDNGAVLKDLGSSNGTYVRVRGSLRLHSGSLILVGQQLFLIEV